MEFEAPKNIPDGVYDAKLVKIVECEAGENSLTGEPYLRWELEVDAEGDTQ